MNMNTTSARRDLAAEEIASYIERVVSAAPPLTTEQRQRIASLLGGSPVKAAYRVGPKLLRLDADELDRVARRIPTAGAE